MLSLSGSTQTPGRWVLKTGVLCDTGVATRLIHLVTHIDSWQVRLKRAEGGGYISAEEWTNFYQVLDDWINSVRETLSLVGDHQNDLDRSVGKLCVR